MRIRGFIVFFVWVGFRVGFWWGRGERRVSYICRVIRVGVFILVGVL